jgi:hypothetical protein
MDEIKDRINQAKEDRLRQNSSSLKDHVRSGPPGGRWGLESNKTDLKGGYPAPSSGPWSSQEPNPTEEPFGVDINYVGPME